MPPNATRPYGFIDIAHSTLDAMSETKIDALAFGVVGLSDAGIVEVYNAAEARLAGLDADAILGAHYFFVVAQGLNNFMIAQRFEDEAELYVVIDYVLTLRMRPTPVRLRLLKSAGVYRATSKSTRWVSQLPSTDQSGGRRNTMS